MSVTIARHILFMFFSPIGEDLGLDKQGFHSHLLCMKNQEDSTRQNYQDTGMLAAHIHRPLL